MVYKKNALGIPIYVGSYEEEKGDLYKNNRSKTLWYVRYAYDADDLNEKEQTIKKMYKIRRVGVGTQKYVWEDDLQRLYTKQEPAFTITLGEH